MITHKIQKRKSWNALCVFILENYSKICIFFRKYIEEQEEINYPLKEFLEKFRNYKVLSYNGNIKWVTLMGLHEYLKDIKRVFIGVKILKLYSIFRY